MRPSHSNLSLIVGNGLSIAFNPSLNLSVITRELVNRIRAENIDGDAVTQAMQRIADRYVDTGHADPNDFENFVGVFGGEAAMLEELQNLASIIEPDNKKLQGAVKRVSEFATQVRDVGTSHVLEVIFEQSRAHQDMMASLYSLIETVTDDFSGRITVGNLNYDTLLLSALLHTSKSELADMGHGYKTHPITTTRDGVQHEVHQLRTTMDYPPSARIRLVHLHGSLTFWRSPNNHIVKLDMDFLDTYMPWESVRDQSTTLRPVVVLANQKDKSGLVAQHPFLLAYDTLRHSLRSSDHWLVVGYSFKDSCVNEVLREEFALRESPPTVLISTKGAQPTRREVERALGWTRDQGRSNGWLTIHRDGANDLATSTEWAKFSASQNIKAAG